LIVQRFELGWRDISDRLEKPVLDCLLSELG